MIIQGQAPETWTPVVAHLLEEEIMLGVSFSWETPNRKTLLGASQVKRGDGV